MRFIRWWQEQVAPATRVGLYAGFGAMLASNLVERSESTVLHALGVMGLLTSLVAFLLGRVSTPEMVRSVKAISIISSLFLPALVEK